MNGSPDKYYQLLQKKFEIVEKMQWLTHLQEGLLENEDYDEFQKKLDQREGLMKKYDDIDKEMSLMEKGISKDENALNLEKKISDILSEIREYNSKMMKEVEDKRTSLTQEIRDINSNRKGLVGYGNLNYEQHSYYFDKKE